jgi:hypothetical protein
MPEHYTKNTVEASVWCNRCNGMTPWRISDGRRSYCLVCYDAPHHQRAQEKPPEPDPQGKLFNGGPR